MLGDMLPAWMGNAERILASAWFGAVLGPLAVWLADPAPARVDYVINGAVLAGVAAALGWAIFTPSQRDAAARR